MSDALRLFVGHFHLVLDIFLGKYHDNEYLV